jgi:hypothetical protein
MTTSLTRLSSPPGNCILERISISKTLASQTVRFLLVILGSKHRRLTKYLIIARRLLEKYRPKIPCFNDDIQGTGCVTLAAIMAGLHVSKQKLGDLRMVIFGAGTAGVGIADQVRDAIATDRNISKEEAAKQIW